MKYSLRVTLAGLFLLVPDEELKAVHVLMPRHGPHSGDGENPVPPAAGHPHAGHDAPRTHGEKESSEGHAHSAHGAMPPHDAQLAFEAERGLPPVLLNGFDLNLTGLTLDPRMPTIPDGVFGLLDDTTVIACPREIARSSAAAALFNARLTLRGGKFEVLATGMYRMPDGSEVELAGMLEWSIELPGRYFPSVALLSLGRGEPSSLPSLHPLSDGLDSHTVQFGVVHAPEPIRVATLEQVTKPKSTYGSDHLEMLYGVIPGVTKPIIPTPILNGGRTTQVFWPNRCVFGKTN